MNPFRKDDNQIVIEVPNIKLNTFSYVSRGGNFNIDNITTNHLKNIEYKFSYGFKNLSVNDSDIKANSSQLSIKNSTLKNNHVNLNNGFINVYNSNISDSIFY